MRDSSASRVVEGVTVTDVLTEPTAAGGDRGAGLDRLGGEPGETEIECEYVVNCAGMWARELGERNGLVIPNQAAEHYYLITDTIEGIDPDAPIFEDPSSYGYYREEGGGMMVGLFEPGRRRLAGGRASRRTSPSARSRPTGTGWRRSWRRPWRGSRSPWRSGSGPSSAVPSRSRPTWPRRWARRRGLRGYFVAAGMNSVGVLSAGGLGRVLAHWITSGRPDVDVTGFDVDRFRRYQLEPDYRAARTTEILGTVYAAHTPGKQLRTARNALLSPVHDRLVASGRLPARGVRLGGCRLVRRARRHRRRGAHLGPGPVVRAAGRPSIAPSVRASV